MNAEQARMNPYHRPVFQIVELNPYAPRPYVFTEAASCLRDSIRLAGYACSLRNNEADPRGISIVLGAWQFGRTMVEALDRNRTIIFNLEQLGATDAFPGKPYEDWLRERIVFDYHAGNIERMATTAGGRSRFFEVPIVPTPSLATSGHAPSAPEVDVLFFASESPRREEIVRRLQAAGLTIDWIRGGAFGTDLAPAMIRSRIVLNVHYYQTRLAPSTRMLQAAVRGVPIVSETSVQTGRCDWSRSGVLFADYDDVVEACRTLIDSPERRLQSVQRTLHFVARLEFALAFEEAITALGFTTAYDTGHFASRNLFS